MKTDSDILIILAVQFSVIALLSLGGANAVLPEIHRQAVDVRGWITDRQFADMFAIAQAIPGPSILIVTLLGYQVAGFWGALVITLAMCGPTSVLAGILSRTWYRFKDAPWRIAVQAGLVPISVGLVGASAILLTQVAVHSVAAGAIAAAAAAVTYWTRWNPLWLIGAAGLLGLAGLAT
jgi:chromate transporter